MSCNVVWKITSCTIAVLIKERNKKSEFQLELRNKKSEFQLELEFTLFISFLNYFQNPFFLPFFLPTLVGYRYIIFFNFQNLLHHFVRFVYLLYRVCNGFILLLFLVQVWLKQDGKSVSCFGIFTCISIECVLFAPTPTTKHKFIKTISVITLNRSNSMFLSSLVKRVGAGLRERWWLGWFGWDCCC